jgi:hypothetical protein
MKIRGHIRIWVDGERACARLTADGREGPIIIQASAPLEDVRREVADALARRGHRVSDDDPGFRSVVHRVARKKAVARLKTLAPGAFVQGGLAAYVAGRQLVHRRRARRRLAQGGLPVGMKPIGPLPDHDEMTDQYNDETSGWRRRHRRRHLGRMGAAPALPPGTDARQVRSAGRLLKAAKRNRRARKRVFKIAALAASGNPNAQVAMQALKVADRAQKAQAKRSTTRQIPPGRAPLALPAVGPTPTARPLPERHGFFWAWHPHVLRSRS